MEHPLFFVGLSFILTHEMDAIRSFEWRMFPLTSALEDGAGYFVFTALHVPLYFLLFWGLYRADGLNHGLVMGLDVFFVVRVTLHLIFLKHPENRFTSPLSWALILGAGIAGLLDLAVGF